MKFQANFNFISPKASIFLKYHQVHIDLLNPKYDTNCFEYDLDYKFANNNMRSDCITHCYQNSKRQKCNKQGIIPSPYLLRKEIFLHDNTLKFTDDCNDQDNVLNDCMVKCKNDCKFKYYFYQKSPNGIQQDNKSQLIIQHSPLPDLKIEHLPEVTFVMFIGNFGGLLGMWLGLSILAMFDSINSLVCIFVQQRKMTNITVINNNITNNNNNFPIFIKRSKSRLSRTNHVNLQN